MFALAAWQWVGSAAALPAIAVMSNATVKAVGRWLGRAITQTMSEAITDTMQPQLADVERRLSEAIASVGVAGSAEHTDVINRVALLEGRVKAVELRLPVVSAPTEEVHP